MIPTTKEESKRRFDALEATKTPEEPLGNITKASEILGDVLPSALSRWFLNRRVKVGNQPRYSAQQCIDELHRLTKKLKRLPARDDWKKESPQGVAWRTHWSRYSAFIKDAKIYTPEETRILLLDIETAPNRAYFWGPVYKQNINPDWIDANGYVLCWTAKWLGSNEVIFERLKNKNHKALLRPMHDLLDEAHAVVHYNGKKFDVPTLNKEFLTHGLNPPSPYKQVDLIKTMWEQFLFPSNKLDYICKTLNLGGKIRHEGPQLWMDCMADKEEAWAKMEAYNRRDVELLEQLYKRLLPWIKGHPNRAAMTEEPSCPSCGSGDYERDGVHLAQVLKYARYQCAECGTWFRGTKTISLRKTERFAAAV